MVATPTGRGDVVVTREVTLPNLQRQTLVGAGDDDHQAIVAGATLYLRGPLAAEHFDGGGSDGWVAMPIADLAPDTELGHVLAGLGVTPASPLAGLREGLRPQELRDLGTIEVGDRTCRAFGGADTTAIGTRQDITVAIDDADLPCLIETRVGSAVVSRIVYSAFNEVFGIDVPAATPVAVPTDATPLARD